MRNSIWAGLVLAVCGAAPLAAQGTVPRMNRPVAAAADSLAIAIVRGGDVRPVRAGADLVVRSICAVRDDAGRSVGARVLIANQGTVDAEHDFWIASEYTYPDAVNMRVDSTAPLPAGQTRWIELRHLASAWVGGAPLVQTASRLNVIVDAHFTRRRPPPTPPGYEREELRPTIRETSERNNSLSVAMPLGLCAQRAPGIVRPPVARPE